MKTKTTARPRSLYALLLVLAGASLAAAPAEKTALELVPEGNRYVGEQSKDKVVQIHSERSVGSLTPRIWYVVYYDPDAKLKAVQVKFGAGQKLDVKRPLRLLQPITKADEPLNMAKVKIDSDRAVEIASKEPLLANLNVRASRLSLERRSADDAMPIWKVRLWAEKLKNPTELADVGEVMIVAENGTVLERNLKPEHVD